MPFGYSYLEMFKAREKGSFLAKHMSGNETKLFITFYFLGKFILISFFFSFFISLNAIYFSFSLLCLNSILAQNFRRIMYLKYGYNKKESDFKTLFLNIFLFVGFFISLAFLMGFSILDWLKELL